MTKGYRKYEMDRVDLHGSGENKKTSGMLELLGSEFTVPATVICGTKPGKTVLVTAGIHGGEYVGIQAAVELAAEIRPEQVSGRIILVKAVCREAFEHRQGSISREDHKNLNQVFPGDPEGTVTERLACALTATLYPEADYYIDLHSGDDYEELTPFIYYAGMADPEVTEASRQMARQADVPYMVRSEVRDGGAYNYAASRGIPAVLLERGGMGSRTEEEIQSTKKDVYAILDHLGILSAGHISRAHYPLEVTDMQYQAASCFGLWYPEKKPGDLCVAGELLGVTRDYEGNILEESVAQKSGVILYQTGSLQVCEDGPMIAYGEIDDRSDDRKEQIAGYWTKRSEDFLVQRREELHSSLAERFLSVLRQNLPGGGRKLKILDAGCGTGFFSILLARQGHQVTGIDLTPGMIRGAEQLAEEELTEEERKRCSFLVMDAEKPDFPDGEFDAVVTRNLTWTLPDPWRAYREWTRVLKKDGVLLNFDADYGKEDCTEVRSLPANHAHHRLGMEMLEECERLKRQLSISSFSRPGWDLDALEEAGMTVFQVELGIGRRLYLEKDQFYNPTPLFLIRASREK
jgi:predicted deacylase/SAM-dependent methyltransferase